MISEVVRVGNRYTIVIPRRVRTALGIKKGQMLRMTLEEGKIVIEPLPDDPFKEFEEVLGDFHYSREDRRRAEEFLLKEARDRAGSGY